MSAQNFNTRGDIWSQPKALLGSSFLKASYTSNSVIVILLNCVDGTRKDETGGSLKLLFVKVELKNSLKSLAFWPGSLTI